MKALCLLLAGLNAGCTVSFSACCEKQWQVEPWAPDRPDATTRLEWKVSKELQRR